MLKHFFKSSMGLVFITAISYSLFLSFILIKNNYDFSRFILLGPTFSNINEIPKKISIVTECLGKTRYGFDGQFYYRLSLNPFTNKETDNGIRIDSPQLRQQRILYPLLVRLLSFGNNALVPAKMILVNLLALCLIAWFSGEIMKHLKINIYWGLLLPFYPGFAISLSRDLTEILGICLLTIALWGFLKNKLTLSVIFASLAVLARETTIVFAIGFLFFYLYEIIFKNKKIIINKILFALIPMLTFFIWQLFLLINWHKTGIGVGLSNDLAIPFSGIISNLLNNNLTNLRNGIEIIYLLSIIAVSFIAIKKSLINKSIKFCWATSLLIFFFVSAKVWTSEFDFMRAFSELYFFSILITLASKSVSLPIKKIIVISTSVFWLAFTYSAFLITQLCVFIPYSS